MIELLKFLLAPAGPWVEALRRFKRRMEARRKRQRRHRRDDRDLITDLQESNGSLKEQRAGAAGPRLKQLVQQLQPEYLLEDCAEDAVATIRVAAVL